MVLEGERRFLQVWQVRIVVETLVRPVTLQCSWRVGSAISRAAFSAGREVGRCRHVELIEPRAEARVQLLSGGHGPVDTTPMGVGMMLVSGRFSAETVKNGG